MIIVEEREEKEEGDYNFYIIFLNIFLINLFIAYK